MHNHIQTPLAILGVGCYVPGARNIEEYWSLLMEGRYPISRAPDNLLDRELYYDPRKGIPGKTNIQYVGLVECPRYDPKYHPYPDRLAEFVDTVPLMMCRAAADAYRDARMDPFGQRHSRTGVYVGCNASGPQIEDQKYALIVGNAGNALARMPTFQEWAGQCCDTIARETVQSLRSGIAAASSLPYRLTSSHAIANAVSEAYGLTGPSVVVDAVCASALEALAVAQHDLENGIAEMALVGGAYVHGLDTLLSFGMSRAATNGRSAPFSARADGIVISEGFIMVLVKTLDRALAERSPIQSVIRGIGLSADGKGKGTWAPRKEGQVEAMRRAYVDESDMSRLAYLEAHATATPVGDLTEMEAIGEVFRGRLPKNIPTGSVKANIGHTMEAAGLAGLVKALLVLRHNIVPRQIHCEPLNSEVRWDELPVFVPRQNTPLETRPDGKPRLAGINAFGIGGVGAHVLIEEPLRLAESHTNRSIARAHSATAGANQALLPRTSAPVNPRNTEPIAIVGCGAIFPGAREFEAFRKLVFSSDEAIDIGKVPDDRWYCRDPDPATAAGSGGADRRLAQVAGFVRDFEYDWRRHRISPKQIDRANPLLFMLMDSVDAALADAGYAEGTFDRKRTEIVVGTNFETDYLLEWLMSWRIPHFVRAMKEVCRKHGFDDEEQLEAMANRISDELLRQMPARLDELGSFTPSGLATRLAKVFDLMGGARTIDSGDTSGLAAIAQAVNSLRIGASSLAICLAGARSVGLQLHAARYAAGNPLSSGFSPPAEGAAAFVLKRLRDAQRDGNPVRAVIHSIGAAFSSDANDAFTQAIHRAWEPCIAEGGPLSPACVRLIELSAADNTVRRSELRALADFYGPWCHNAPIMTGCADSPIGDTMAASGMASMIKAIVEMEELAVPEFHEGCRPTVDWDANAIDPLFVPNQRTRLGSSISSSPLLAAISSYDSFGSVYHVILERGTRVPMSPTTPQLPCPLISRTHRKKNGESVAEVVFDPRKDRFLQDHQLRMRPLLPGVIVVESFAQAATRLASDRRAVAIHDLRFIEGLRFLDDSPKTGRIYVQPQGDSVHCRLAVDLRNRRGDLVKADRVHATGIVQLGHRIDRLDVPCPSGCPVEGWYDLIYFEPGSMMYHGPTFQQLQRLAFADQVFWGECEISSPEASGNGLSEQEWMTAPATTDACLYLGGIAFIKLTGGIMGLPRSVDHLRFGRPPRRKEACLIHATLVNSGESEMTFDFVVFGEDGDAILQCQGYHLQAVPTSRKHAPRKDS